MLHNKLAILKKKSGKTIDEISQLSGIPKGTLNKIFAGVTKDPQLETVKTLLYSIGYTLTDLDDEPVTSESSVATPDQQSLINTYEQLNGEGKQKLTDYANDLALSGRYNTDNDIRTYKVAARNGKDTITLTKEQREKMIKLVAEAPEPPDGVY